MRARQLRWLLLAVAVVIVPFFMQTRILNSLLYFPARTLDATPSTFSLEFKDVDIRTADGERLHGWFIPARSRPLLGHVLHLHGNGGNISHRLDEAAALAAAGFDVLLFDYRGYGRSTGSPSEAGTHDDARAARTALLGQDGVDVRRILYLGESLGGAVALALAVEAPPCGLVLQSTFTSVKDLARRHYPFIPTALVPNAYPSLTRMAGLRAPLLVLHGDRDDLVPLAHGLALFAAAPEPKRMEVFPGAGHNDLVLLAGRAWAATIAAWARSLAC